MNLTLILVAIIAFSAACGGSYYQGRQDGKAGMEADIAREERVAQVASDAAIKASGEAINKIVVKNTTIKQAVEREIRENTVYRDCKLTPDGLRGVNAAITGAEAEPTVKHKLPGIGAAE